MASKDTPTTYWTERPNTVAWTWKTRTYIIIWAYPVVVRMMMTVTDRGGVWGGGKLKYTEPDVSLWKISRSLDMYSCNWKTWFLPLELKMKVLSWNVAYKLKTHHNLFPLLIRLPKMEITGLFLFTEHRHLNVLAAKLFVRAHRKKKLNRDF